MEKTFEKIVRVHTALVRDGHAINTTVEVALGKGIGIHFVGLVDSAVKESLLRIVTALQSLGYAIPGKKVIINILPANKIKSFEGFDLPIAIALLCASGQVEVEKDLLEGCLFYGGLKLDGTIRNSAEFNGAGLAVAAAGLVAERRALITCTNTAVEAAAVTQVVPYAFPDLETLLRVLRREILGTEWVVWNTPAWGRVEGAIELMKNQKTYPL